MSIYQNKFLEIKKKTNHYVLVFKETEHNINNFIEKTCSMIDYSKKIGTKNIEITFHAKSVETLSSLLKTKKNKLSYRHAQNIFFNFSKQISALEKQQKGIVSLDINDFIVINPDEDRFRYNSQIIFVNIGKILPIENNFFVLKKPGQIANIKSSKFISPEINNINEIPAKIHKNTIYYSIGKLLTFSLNREVELKEKKDYELALESICESKLYYGIIRCIENNPHERYYLYI